MDEFIHYNSNYRDRHHSIILIGRAMQTQTKNRYRLTRPMTAMGAIVVISLLSAGGFAFGKQKHDSGKTPVKTSINPVLTVTTTRALTKSMPDAMTVTGSIFACDPLSIGSSANGLSIVSVDVEEGQYVKKGQVLCRLDSSVLQAQLAGTRARYSSARATTSKAQQPNRPEDIASFEAAYQQAQSDVQQKQAMLDQSQATLKLASDTAQRYRNLLRDGAVSQLEAQGKATDAVTARASVEAQKQTLQAARFAAQQAQNKLSMAHQGGRREDIDISLANAQESAANVDQLEAQIAQTIVRAPDDGLITVRHAHIGDINNGGKVLFEMIRKGDLELRAQVAQQDLARLSIGQEAKLEDGTRSGIGKVYQISPTVDSSTRLGTVKIALKAQGSTFKPGMFVKGTIAMGQKPALVVPSAAVLAAEERSYVFVERDGLAIKREVTIGSRKAEMAQILSGINEGEAVIVAGAGFLNDRDPIRIANN